MSDYPLVNTQTSNIVYVNFPKGSLYGFPIVLDRDNNLQSMLDWLISKGVPYDVAYTEQNNLRIYSVPQGASLSEFIPKHEVL